MCASIDTLLHDAASMLMTSNVYVSLIHCIINELIMLTGPALKNFLNHVVSVDILAHFFQEAFQLLLDHCEMFG
jgi:hypothetical protein